MNKIELFKNRIESIVNLNDLNRLDRLIVNAKDFCLLNGLVMFDAQNDLSVLLSSKEKYDNEININIIDDLMKKNFKVIYSPIALFPTLFPKKEFDYAMNVQENFNKLIYLVSLNHEFLIKAYRNIIKHDNFSKRLFDIYEIIRSEGISQVLLIQSFIKIANCKLNTNNYNNKPISLCIMRNDYVLDMNKLGKETMLSQIEYNTISCASGAAASQVTKLHRYKLNLNK